MSRPQFTESAWEEYCYWQLQDKKTLKKINKLISDILRKGALEGEGKPELLKGNLTGFCSRRINEKDRLIYRVIDSEIVEIYSCIGTIKIGKEISGIYYPSPFDIIIHHILSLLSINHSL